MRLLLAILILILSPLPAQAKSPFDGAWIWDAAATELPSEPDVFEFHGGTFRCVSCPVPWAATADGALHAVSGQSGFDEVTITTPDANTLIVNARKAGRDVRTTKYQVTSGGAELRTETIDRTAATPTVTTMLSGRVGPGKTDEHRLSGSWRQTRIESASENASIVRLKVTSRTIKFSDPSGFAYRARFDGKDYPVSGMGKGRTVSVRRLAPDSFEETQKQDGKPVSIISLTVARDGQTARYVFNDLVENVVSRGTLRRKLATKDAAI